MAVNNACGRWDINEGDLKILDALLTELGSAEHADFIDEANMPRELEHEPVPSIPGLQAEQTTSNE